MFHWNKMLTWWLPDCKLLCFLTAESLARFRPVICITSSPPMLVRKKIRKRRLFKTVQAFCEEKVLRYLLGVFWYAESKNQCWQAEKWRLHYLICIFPRWPPNWRKIHKNMKSNVLRMQNWFKSIQKYLLLIGGLHWHQFMQLELKIWPRGNQGRQLEQKILHPTK